MPIRQASASTPADARRPRLLEGYDASMMAYASVVCARHATPPSMSSKRGAQARWLTRDAPARPRLRHTARPGTHHSSEADRLAVGMEVPLDEVARLGTLSARDGAILVVDLGGDDSYFGRVGTPNLAGVVAGNGETFALHRHRHRPRRQRHVRRRGPRRLHRLRPVRDRSDLRSRRNDRYLGAATPSPGSLRHGPARRSIRHRSVRHLRLPHAGHRTAASLCSSISPATTNYTLDAFGQGLGGTRGAGLLIDLDGNDQYRARDNGWNLPTYRDLSASYAQGVGYGRARLRRWPLARRRMGHAPRQHGR